MLISFIIYFVIFLIILILYLRIANFFNIISYPNERGSHSSDIVRGGGIIFVVAALIPSVSHFEVFYWLCCSIIFISIVSFLDDIFSLSVSIRIIFQFASVSSVFIFFNIFGLKPLSEIVMLYILAIGIINAFNFMDGVNGMTGSYGLIILAGIQWVNLNQLAFINPDLIWIPLAAVSAFLFFNFRKVPLCFAGDVGSVTIGLWIVILLFSLILKSNNWTYILFLAVYGVDTVLTILHRLLLKQNILKAHRQHLYQLLANENKIPHLLISACYSLIQLLIILLVVFNSTFSVQGLFLISILPLMLIYLLLKPRIYLQT